MQQSTLSPKLNLSQPKTTKQKVLLAVSVVLIVAALAGVIALLVNLRQKSVAPVTPDINNSLQDTSVQTGNIPDKVLGDPATVAVTVYEYADYACAHCASWNFRLEDLMQQYPGQIAIVFRGVDVGFQNGRAAAKAATAAQIQGFWPEYKNLLFADQADWLYLKEQALSDKFVEYFATASSGQGDLERFRSDLTSSEVIARVDAEQQLGQQANVHSTPTFIIDGEMISLDQVVETIEQRVES